VENAGGLGRHLAGRLAAAGESVVDVPPKRAARIVRGIRPQGASACVRRRLASEVLRDIRTLERKIADLNELTSKPR
jgi:NAD(P)-dependent dehydrogenase (short-subunit alcohol dehydrogenase family)